MTSATVTMRSALATRTLRLTCCIVFAVASAITVPGISHAADNANVAPSKISPKANTDSKPDKPATADEAAAIAAKFMLDSTGAIWRIDTQQLDLEASFDKIVEMLERHFVDDKAMVKNLDKEFRGLAREGMKGLDAFFNAGAREMFLFGNLSPMSRDEFGTIVLTIAKDKEPKQIHQFMIDNDEDGGYRQAIAAGNVAFKGRYIVIAGVETMKLIDTKTKEREAVLRDAFGSMEGDPIQVVLTLPEYARRTVEDLMPTLPKSFGGGQSKVLTRGVDWIAVGISLPPHFRVRVAIQSPDAKHARAVSDLATLLATKYPWLPSDITLPDAAAKKLKLKQAGDRLTLMLDEHAIDQFIEATVPAFKDAKLKEMRTRAATNMRHIAIGCQFYASENEGKYPPTIGELLKDDYINAELGLSPLDKTQQPFTFNVWEHERKITWLNKNTSFVYIPGLKNDQDSKTIVLFEKHRPKLDKIAVMFNDGHYEFMRFKDANERVQKQTGHTIEQWSKVDSGERPK